jgi:hypothetical protein
MLTESGRLSAPPELQVSSVNEHCEAGVELIESILIYGNVSPSQ